MIKSELIQNKLQQTPMNNQTKQTVLIDYRSQYTKYCSARRENTLKNYEDW